MYSSIEQGQLYGSRVDEKPTVFGCWYPSDCGFGGLTVVVNTVAQLHYDTQAVCSSYFLTVPQNFHAFKVLYDRGKQWKLLDTILADAIKAFNDFPFSMSSKSEYDLVIGKHVGKLLQCFDLICMRFKDDAFSEEREWRFSADIDANSLDFVKFRDANGLVIPYLELPITAEGIEVKRIVCGPTLHPELSKRSVEMLARKNGFRNVEVVNSRIPLGAF